MVDWDRVGELRSKGWDWERIAADPKVSFHADSSVRDPGRALRALYHRTKARERRQGPEPQAPTKRTTEEEGQRWGLPRIGYLTVPLLGVWFALAYVAPSPVGLIVPAIPWLALGLAVAGFVLAFGLWRSRGAPRWSPVYRTTLLGGVVLGLVIGGLIGLSGSVLFGCPYLPPASSLTGTAAPGWTSGGLPAWQDAGKPVVYFYGSTWCPYCSASSWAIWKALEEFGTPSGEALGYSSSTDVYPRTPEMVLAHIQLNSPYIAFQVSEDTSGVGGSFPGTSSCTQQAYLSAYSGNTIPFVVVNGQYVHGGASLINPATLSSWAGFGAGTVNTSVNSETGAPWTAVQSQSWWVMAMLLKTTGLPASTFSGKWTSSTMANVTAYEAQLP
jgi:uncharacterized protein DUF929